MRDGGIPGVVIRLSAKGFGDVELVSETRVKAGAAICPDKNLAAMRSITASAASISSTAFPARSAAHLRMNAGANGGETRDRVVEVHAVDRKGNKHVLTNAEMGYTYRHSSAPSDLIFTHAGLSRAIRRNKAKIRAGMDAVRQHRETVQPIREKTGGSTFKNPDGIPPGS